MEDYKKKYLEYKLKYIQLKQKKNQIGGILKDEIKKKIADIDKYLTESDKSILASNREYLNFIIFREAATQNSLDAQTEGEFIKSINYLFNTIIIDKAEYIADNKTVDDEWVDGDNYTSLRTNDITSPLLNPVFMEKLRILIKHRQDNLPSIQRGLQYLALHKGEMPSKIIDDINIAFMIFSGTTRYLYDNDSKRNLEEIKRKYPEPELNQPYIILDRKHSDAYKIYWEIANGIINSQNYSEEYREYFKRNERKRIQLIVDAADYVGISPSDIFYSPFASPVASPFNSYKSNYTPEQKARIENIKDLRRVVFYPYEPRPHYIPELPLLPNPLLLATRYAPEEEADIKAIKELIAHNPVAKRRQ